MNEALDASSLLVDDSPNPGALAGGESSLRDLVRDLEPWAYRHAVLLTRDAETAHDLVQDAFERLWRKPPDPATAAVLAAWLRTTMYRLFLQRLRSRIRESKALSRVLPPDASADLTEDSIAVRTALRRLSPRQRACIVLRYFDDATESEISEVLGIRLGTVKAHLAQGRNALRAALEI